MPSFWAEAWTRPGDPVFGRVIDDLPTTRHGLHDGMTSVGDGNVSLPDTFDRFDDLLFIDPVTPANCVSCLMRLFSDADPTTPIFEWLPDVMAPSTDPDDRTVEVTGPGIKSLLSYARLEAYDWDGSAGFLPSQPDWEWGAKNALGNPGFEENTVTPKSFLLAITATGGTFTLTDGTDTTAAIAFNAAAATIETRIEVDLGLFIDVVVVQVGTAPTTHRIEMVDPAFGVNLGINPAGLTGGSATTATDVEGGLTPSPWSQARTLISGLPSDQGSYDQFVPTTLNPHTGTYSLLIDPGPTGVSSNRGLGVQQVVNVNPGGLYQASVWVYPLSTVDRFRLALFSIGEEVIAWTADNGVTLPASTWTQLTLSDITMPDNVTQVIFRVQSTNPGPSDPMVFYVDDAEFYPGFAPTTLGEILRQIYAHAINPLIRPTIIWDNGAGSNTPYLTLDFSDLVDSGGNIWAHPTIAIRLWMRMSYLQIMEQFVSSHGYEWRIVPNNVETGTWKWQVYNAGRMKTDHTTAASPAIQGGSSDIRRRIHRRLPVGTDVMIEGLSRLTGRDSDASLVIALGRIESARLDRELPSVDAALSTASEEVDALLIDGLTWGYTLIEPSATPLVAYQIGDLLIVHDPPEVSDDARLVEVTASIEPSRTEWEIELAPASVYGS